MEVIFYTIDCDRCLILEKELKRTGLEYTECRDLMKMKEKNFTEAPMLEVEGICFKFDDAMKFLSEF